MIKYLFMAIWFLASCAEVVFGVAMIQKCNEAATSFMANLFFDLGIMGCTAPFFTLIILLRYIWLYEK